jgi:predicted MFS family arabinose efflux permease
MWIGYTLSRPFDQGRLLATLKAIIAGYVSGFRGLPRASWIIAGVVFLHTAGRMVTTFLAIYLASELHLTGAWIGAIIGSYGAGTIVGAFAGGRLCAVIAARTLMAASLLGSGLGYAMLSMAAAPSVFLMLLFATATLEGGFRPAMNFLLMQNVEAEDRTRSYALQQVALNLGFAVGTVAGGVLSLYQFLLIFWVNGATCILAAVAVYMWRGDEHIRSGNAQPGSLSVNISPWRDRQFLFVALAAVCYYAVFHQRLSTYPLYLVSVYLFDTAQVGLILAAQSVLIVAASVFVTDRLKAVDGRVVGAIGVFLLCVSFGLQPLSDMKVFAVALAMTMTMGEVLAAPALMGLVYGRASGRRAGEFLGIFLTMNNISRSLSPMLGLWAADAFGYAILWAMCAALGLVAAALLLRPPMAGFKHHQS